MQILLAFELLCNGSRFEQPASSALGQLPEVRHLRATGTLAANAPTIDMMDPADLVRVADLLRMGAETARLFSDTQARDNGEQSRISTLSARIEAAADELAIIGRQMVARRPPESPL